MLRLTLDDETLHSVHVVASPLWECIASLAMLVRYRGEPPSPYTVWARAARVALGPQDLRRLLVGGRQLGALSRTAGWLPVPEPGVRDIHTELAQLVAAHHGDERIGQLVTVLQLHWERAVLPWWPAIADSLAIEVHQRWQTLAVDGPRAMLRELGGRLGWHRSQLIAPFHADLELGLQHACLGLVPMVFAGGLRILATDAGRGAAVCYQVNAAVLSSPPSTMPSKSAAVDRLELLVGTGRANILRSLMVPTTTTALAASLGLAPSTVSEHLATLTAAGVVRRQRLGSQVLYELDRSGFTLLRELAG